MSSDVSNTSTTIVSLNSSKNSIQSPIAPVFPVVFQTATLVQGANDDMKLHPSVRVTVEVTGPAPSVGFFMPKLFQ
ncbi:unnamed protein product [Hymenolepis diminuta]|uniref:Uncharacterized protein n=1 Tax=Hymenolepis diminuta TaxID=6216 RepID=A0A564Z695_HYMDI|nr:unnamed protein product [Hymenolepis diminuta]